MTPAAPPADAVRHAVDGDGGLLVDLSHRIHAHPELGFEEEQASTWLAEILADRNFEVAAGAGGLATAFTATAGSGPLRLAICAEYDALPGIGHACGHNMIAAMSVGAALALAPIADDLGLTVTVVGTPAEENGGGKELLVQAGVFDDVHAAMMAHPTPLPYDSATIPLIALANLQLTYTGREAHASAFPEAGINALDALTVAQTAVGLLRQHISPAARIHGIVTHGGDAPNVVPGRTCAHYLVRSPTSQDLEALVPRVMRCFEAGALATGCSLEVNEAPHYDEMDHDEELVELYRRHMRELGRAGTPDDEARPMPAGSSDMGNVSKLVPSIHPGIGLDCLPASNHHPDFTAACITPKADEAVLHGALLLARTAVDAATTPKVVERLTSKRGTEPGSTT